MTKWTYTHIYYREEREKRGEGGGEMYIDWQLDGI